MKSLGYIGIIKLCMAFYAVPFAVFAGEAAKPFSDIIIEKQGIKISARIRNIYGDNCSYAEKWLKGYPKDECPDTAIDKLEIVHKGASINIPDFAYNDIFNIDDISINNITKVESGDFYDVVIRTGGHRSVKNNYILSFKGTVLLERVVQAPQWGGRTKYIYDAEKKVYSIGKYRNEYGYGNFLIKDGQIKVYAIVKGDTPGNCMDVHIGWGAYNLCPGNALHRLDVHYAGKPVYIPVSAYNDLFSVSEVLVVPYEDSGKYLIHIRGGDLYLSRDQHYLIYHVYLFFEKDAIVKRIVKIIETDINLVELREETNYRYH